MSEVAMGRRTLGDLIREWKAKQPRRACIDCGTTIVGGHASRLRCPPCAKARQMQQIRDWDKTHIERRRELDREGWKRRYHADPVFRAKMALERKLRKRKVAARKRAAT